MLFQSFQPFKGFQSFGRSKNNLSLFAHEIAVKADIAVYYLYKFLLERSNGMGARR